MWAALFIILLLAPFAIELIWDTHRSRRFRKNGRPRLKAILTTKSCPWCASQGLAWDGRFRPALLQLVFWVPGTEPGPDPVATLLLQCKSCRRHSAFELYPDLSMQQLRGHKRQLARRCLECGYCFSGVSETACHQCKAVRSIELTPVQIKTCLACEQENEVTATTCSRCRIPLDKSTYNFPVDR